jgi:epoxyqueuosine reductase
MKSSGLFENNFLESLGILDWGYTEESIPSSLSHFTQWVAAGHADPLNYLKDHRKTLREDIKKVWPEFQSAAVFLFSYQAPKKWLMDHKKYQVAGYALGFGGEDYHRELKKRLLMISDHLKLNLPDLKTFITLDAQPVLERDLAFRAGLGWFGKNSMLIHQKEGSYFLIGSLLLNQKLNVSSGILDSDHCGQCFACIDACPTNAIDPENRTIIASKCISTFTIEIMKESDAPAGFTESRGEVFGCDICQDVCPWNKKVMQKIIGSIQITEKFAFLKELFLDSHLDKLKILIQLSTNRGHKKKFFGTPFDRPGREGWMKNLKAMRKKS